MVLLAIIGALYLIVVCGRYFGREAIVTLTVLVLATRAARRRLARRPPALTVVESLPMRLLLDESEPGGGVTRRCLHARNVHAGRPSIIGCEDCGGTGYAVHSA